MSATTFDHYVESKIKPIFHRTERVERLCTCVHYLRTELTAVPGQ